MKERGAKQREERRLDLVGLGERVPRWEERKGHLERREEDVNENKDVNENWGIISQRSTATLRNEAVIIRCISIEISSLWVVIGKISTKNLMVFLIAMYLIIPNTY